MSRLLSTLLMGAASLLGSASAAFAQAPVTQWDRTFSGPSFDYVHALQLTTDGGYILGGISDSGIGGDKTQANRGAYNDYWVVKVDATGAKQWDQTFGGANSDYLTSLVQTSDGGYLLGGWSSSVVSGERTSPRQGGDDYWIVKLDANGTKQWDRSFGGPGTNNLTTLQQTSDGGYILGGYSTAGLGGDKTQAGYGATDFWLVKIDAVGTKQWDRTYGGTDYETLRSLQQTSDGGFILGGGSFSGVGGDKTQASQGGNDFWVVKVDASGTKQWDRTFGGADSEWIYALQQTSDGGYIAGGTSRSGLSGDKTQASQGITDYWVVKLDANGTKQWDKALGGSSAENLTSLQQTSDGGYLLGGDSNSGSSGDKTQPSHGTNGSNGIDCWLVKLDANGTKQWDKTLGGIGYDVTGGVKQTPDGGYVLGATGSPGSSGDKTQPGVGAADFWLVKLGATPLATKASSAYPALQAYPNPARTQLTLRGPLGTPYQLLNQLGQVVRTGQLSAQPLDVQPLDVQALSAGLYLLRDQISGRTTKFVKE